MSYNIQKFKNRFFVRFKNPLTPNIFIFFQCKLSFFLKSLFLDRICDFLDGANMRC